MSKQQNASSSTPHTDDKLINLEEKSSGVKQASDINNKINHLEDSLGNLQTELNEFNTTVEQGMERLNQRDLSLTSRVSETYKQLGVIDKTYEGLSKMLNSIETDVKNLSREVSHLAEQSTTKIENLGETSARQYSELSELHEKLAQRVDELVTFAQQTHQQLNESVEQNAGALLKLEKQLVNEIDTLSAETRKRNDKLDSRLSSAEQTINVNKANIIKLQGVNEALDKRASQLEKSAAVLTEKTELQQAALLQLGEHGKELAWSVERLKVASDKHAGQIVELQMESSLVKRGLTALSAIEKRHFRMLAAVLLVFILAMASFVYTQQAVNMQDVQQIAGLASGMETVNSRLQEMNDQLDSLDGRMQYLSPSKQFGKDNIIHGPQWLARQPANHFAVQLVTTSSKKELYQIAQRYAPYFTEAMSYYTFDSAYGRQYVLIYGSFASESQAASSLWRIPPYISQQRPGISRIGDIQKMI